MVTVSLYARVSSQKQAQENTIESQIAELERRIISDRYELLDGYKFIDNGYSGSNLERPSLENLRDKVAEGKIDKIYVHSPDRLSRKSAYQALLLEEFRKAGSEVVFLNHKFEDNPESNMFLGIQGLVAEYERAKIMERNRRGKLHAAKTGRISVMSGAPYGYRYIEKHIGEGHAQFEVNEEEAAIVRKMFSWVGEERVSIKEAARRLSNMSIMTRKGKGYWQKSTVWCILKNPAYIGKAAYGKTKTGQNLGKKRLRRGLCRGIRNSRSHNDKENWIYVSVPSIVDEDLFNIVQEQLAENRQRVRARQRSETFLLQSLVLCQRCRYAYNGIHSTSKGRNLIYYYYRCNGTDAGRLNGSKVCDNKLIRTDVLDTVIWEEVKVLLKEPDRIAHEYQRRLSEDKKPLLDQTLEKQESKLERSIARLIDSYSQEYITREEFEPRVKAMRQHLKEIKEQKKMLGQKKLQQEFSIATNSLKQFASAVESKLDQVDWQTKQNIIRTLVRQVEINHDHLYIIFRIKELANLDKNRHNKIMQHCTYSFNGFLSKIEQGKISLFLNLFVKLSILPFYKPFGLL